MAKKTQYLYDPDYATLPGQTILDKIEEMGMTQQELALRLGYSTTHVSQVINGHEPITYQTALGLEKVTGVPASFWINREAIFRERCAKLEEVKRFQDELGWLDNIPIKELLSRKVISRKIKDPDQLREVLSFFGVSSVKAWYDYWKKFISKVAARRSQCLETKIGSLATWLRLGELDARSIECNPYDERNFKTALEKIRTLTVKEPQEFIPEMKKLCADAGVAVVLVPEIKNVPWYGASWWLTLNKAIIVLNLRGKYEDHFWFSFFHEAGHLLHDKKKEVYINDGKSTDPSEQNANKFAADVLIPSSRVTELLQAKTEQHILEMAKSLEISPGILVGRYQKETQHWNYFTRLKKKFIWTNKE